MKYLLDTSACVAILRRKPDSVRIEAKKALRQGSALMISSVVLHELWYGVFKGNRVEENVWQLQAFLAPGIEVLHFDEEDARISGKIRAELEARGTRIGAYDTLIGAQCLRHGLTLVTNNVSEFSRIPGLMFVDWAK
jgi:tRNA(fMet)-specific endonuclease VapC